MNIILFLLIAIIDNIIVPKILSFNFSFYLNSTFKCNFKLAMPDLNGSLETLIWSKMWKISSFFWLEGYVSPLLLLRNKCSCLFWRETAKWKYTVYNSYWSEKKLLRVLLQIWHCICTWRVTWNYAYSPFNSHFKFKEYYLIWKWPLSRIP